MYKKSLSAASLVVAVPGAFLAYLLVMAFLEEPGFTNMAGFFQIISGLALTMVTLMVLMPAIVLIFGPKADPSAKAAEKETDVRDEEEAAGEDLAGDDEGGEALSANGGADFEDDEFGDDDFADDEFGDDAFDDFDDDDEFK